MAISKEESKFIDAMRFIAILMVAAAHTMPDAAISGGIMEILACGGVAVFFFLSGYLFHSLKHRFFEFLMKTVKKLLIPWVLTGTAVYLYTAARHGDIAFGDYLQFIIGLDSYLWYMSITVILYAVFYFAERNAAIFWVMPLFSVCHYLAFPYMYPFLASHLLLYANFAQWVWIFWAGALLRKYSSLQQLEKSCKRYWYLISLMYLTMTIYLVASNTQFAYWSSIYPVYAVLFVLVSTVIANVIMQYRTVRYIGRVSFSIYLLHMPIAGMLAYCIRKIATVSTLAGNVANIVAPIICCAIVSGCIWVYTFLTEKSKYKKLAYMLIGVPQRVISDEQAVKVRISGGG